ncbi:hypothetical protein [Kribbella sp. CA-293567]|uniref:hypothetical protein n=1 Tax=Kribbella sp. CA-293567 TaxID=3002436 RepID=UPI0022DE51D4|nr:hypothetical protein [Kribbella sp. CA-293567]WBQ05597.1 hypothetical protein OX958_02080 [Kribbella sp. CA-293567]
MIPKINCLWPPNWGECLDKYLGEAVTSAIGGFFSLIFDAIKAMVIAAVEAVIKAVGFLWIEIDSPNVQDHRTITFVHDHTQYILVVAASIAVIAGGMKMAISQRGEPLRDIMKSLITMAMVSAGLTGFIALLIQASDQFSAWILDRALGADDNAFAKKLVEKVTDPLKDGGVGLALVILVGILMVITALIQLALMIIRYAMLILLVGVLPLTASATNTEMGAMWFKRAIAWLVAFVIYKPVAALIYATAIKLMSSPTDATFKVITGVTMMVMGVVALPALLRFVSPKAA